MNLSKQLSQMNWKPTNSEERIGGLVVIHGWNFGVDRFARKLRLHQLTLNARFGAKSLVGNNI